ncbi:hypothetical protein, partial [Actinobacillus pleuropneumoniae]|uniref:hypothetical protein n=1 Tax=Actinobacillus pleuropneumoniae TaxID=715 RepID=UPI00227A6F8A
SIEEDYQPLSERLVHLQAAAIAKKKQKGKQSTQEKSTSPYLRRSTRLRGKGSKTPEKQPHFIDLGEKTLEKSPTRPSIESSPPHDESPFRPEIE